MKLYQTFLTLISCIVVTQIIQLPSFADPRRELGNASNRPSQMTDSSEAYGDLVIALQQEISELKKQRKETSDLMERLKNRVQRFEERLGACCPE